MDQIWQQAAKAGALRTTAHCIAGCWERVGLLRCSQTARWRWCLIVVARIKIGILVREMFADFWYGSSVLIKIFHLACWTRCFLAMATKWCAYNCCESCSGESTWGWLKTTGSIDGLSAVPRLFLKCLFSARCEQVVASARRWAQAAYKCKRVPSRWLALPKVVFPSASWAGHVLQSHPRHMVWVHGARVSNVLPSAVLPFLKDRAQSEMGLNCELIQEVVKAGHNLRLFRWISHCSWYEPSQCLV